MGDERNDIVSNYFFNNLKAETCLVQVCSESCTIQGLNGLLIRIFCWCLFPCCLSIWFTVQEKYWLKYFRGAAWSKDFVAIWLAWDKLAGFFPFLTLFGGEGWKYSFFLNVSEVHKWLGSHHDNMGTWIRLFSMFFLFCFFLYLLFGLSLRCLREYLTAPVGIRLLMVSSS